MKITLHQCHLTHDELVTIFYELAMHLNLRPLTEDITDGLLTPAHFLFGVTHIQGIISPAVDPITSLDRAWKNRKRIGEHLIKRWTDEYLQTLRAWSSSPRGRAVRTPRIGEVVLVHGEGSRGRWPIARVQSLIEGRDGTPRAAVVSLRGRQTRRPATKLYRLEASSDSIVQSPMTHITPEPLPVSPGTFTPTPVKPLVQVEQFVRSTYMTAPRRGHDCSTSLNALVLRTCRSGTCDTARPLVSCHLS